jgi:pyruvate dehydrogenase (quinone)
MRIETGIPKFPGSQDLPDFRYADFAKMLGFEGIRVERPEEVGEAWEYVLRAERPAVLEFVTDPAVAMLPPHITLEQAKAFAGAVLRGDPEARPVVAESVKGVFAGVAPGKARNGDQR